ncbi:MAG: hypothetical protein AAFQ82_06985, partial [Myxococcota bacterium]
KYDPGGRSVRKRPYFIRALGVGAPATPVELSLRSGIEIIAGESVYRRIALAAPAQVVVRASDPAGRQLPVKVSVVGEYDSIGRSESVEDLINELALGDTRRPTDLGETLPLVSRTRRYLEGVAWGGGDPVRVAVRPTDCASVSTCETGARIGGYRIVVSRGPEYEIVELEDVSLSPGEVRTFDVILEKTVDTEGYLAVDFDVKSEASPGGQWTPTQRARVAAAEGLEAYFAADANQIVSAEGEPSAAGIQQWIRAFDAVELTTLERGENLILPLTVDNSRSNGLPSAGGCIAGSGADTLGAVLGGFECTMSQLWSRTRTLGSRGASFALVFASHPRRGIRGQLNQFSVSGNGEPTTPTALNDIWLGWPLSSTYRDGVLNPLQVELREYDGLMVWHGKATANLQDFSPPAETELDPATANDVLFDLRNYQCADGHPNNGLGSTVFREGGDIRFPGPWSDFERQLGLGRPMVALAASGSLGAEQEPGAPRSYVWVGSDAERGVIDRRPAAVSDADILNGIFQGRVLVSNGPFLDLRLRTPNAAGDDVVLWPVGSFVRYASPPNPDTGVDLTAVIRLRTPTWIRVETIRLRVNGDVVETLVVPDTPSSDGGLVANEWLFPVDLTLFEDSFVTAEVEGEQNLFPVVIPFQEPEDGVDAALGAVAQAFGVTNPYARGDGLRSPTPVQAATPFAVTNPILLDVDASGAYRGPGVPELPPAAPEVLCPPGLE